MAPMKERLHTFEHGTASPDFRTQCCNAAVLQCKSVGGALGCIEDMSTAFPPEQRTVPYSSHMIGSTPNRGRPPRRDGAKRRPVLRRQLQSLGMPYQKSGNAPGPASPEPSRSRAKAEPSREGAKSISTFPHSKGGGWLNCCKPFSLKGTYRHQMASEAPALRREYV